MPSLGPPFTVVRSEQDHKSGRLPLWVCRLVVDASPVRRFCTFGLCGCSVAPWRRAASLWFISLCGPNNVGVISSGFYVAHGAPSGYHRWACGRCPVRRLSGFLVQKSIYLVLPIP